MYDIVDAMNALQQSEQVKVEMSIQLAQLRQENARLRADVLRLSGTLAQVEDVIREVRAEYTGPTAGVADAPLACDEILARIRGEK